MILHEETFIVDVVSCLTTIHSDHYLVSMKQVNMPSQQSYDGFLLLSLQPPPPLLLSVSWSFSRECERSLTSSSFFSIIHQTTNGSAARRKMWASPRTPSPLFPSPSPRHSTQHTNGCETRDLTQTSPVSITFLNESKVKHISRRNHAGAFQRDGMFRLIETSR